MLLNQEIWYVPVCTGMYSLVCYSCVVLVTIVRKTMLMKLLVYISYWKSAESADSCLKIKLHARAN